MLEYVFDENLKDNEPAIYSAYNQRWDKATLDELRDKYDVIFMTGGDGVVPVKIIAKESSNPSIALGTEDDGTIIFPRKYGDFANRISTAWIPFLIKDLEEVMRIIDLRKEVEMPS